MAEQTWFHNFYKCDHCKHKWDDSWDSMVDTECPECGLKNMSPLESEEVSREEAEEFAMDPLPEPDGALAPDPHYRGIRHEASR